MDGHRVSAAMGYDIFGNVGAAAAGDKDGNCHNASVHAGTTGAIVCGGNPFLTNPDPVHMAGHHTASWSVMNTEINGANRVKYRFYSWSGIVQGGKSRYWTFLMPPGANAAAAPDIKNNAALFTNPTWPTLANPNGANTYVAGVTNQGWIEAESFNNTPLDGATRGFCEGQFASGTSYAMVGHGNMEDPGPSIACTWLNFDATRKSANPNADCRNLCTARSQAWPGRPYSAAFKAACDTACDTCLPPPGC
jgi:hypothetical protein